MCSKGCEKFEKLNVTVVRTHVYVLFCTVRFLFCLCCLFVNKFLETLNILANPANRAIRSFWVMLCSGICLLFVLWESHERWQCKHFVKLFALRANKNCSTCATGVVASIEIELNYMWKICPKFL